MNARLRLFAADHGILVIEGEVLRFARLTPAEVASRSARILAGEAPHEALQPDGEEAPLRELRRLEGTVDGRDLQLGGSGWSLSLTFPDRKSRDAALEALAEGVGRPLEIRRVRRGWEVLVAYVLIVSAVGLAAAAWKADWSGAAKAAGQGGAALLVLIACLAHPRRRIGLTQQ